MNPLDIGIIVLFAYCLIRGIFIGLIKQIASIIGVLAGFYASYTYYPELSRAISPWIADPSFSRITSFFIIFSGVFFLVSIVGVVIKYLMNIVFLGWLDRLLGAGLGFVKAVLIASVVLVVLTSFLPKNTPLLAESKLSRHVTIIAEHLAWPLKNEMKKEYSSKLEALKKTWEARQ